MMAVKHTWSFFFLFLTYSAMGQNQTRLFYAGSSGNETFYDVVQLSDGTVLIAGSAEDLDWVPVSATQVALANHTIENNQGTNRYAFLLQTDSTLSNVLSIVFLEPGAAENFRFIKSTNAPRQSTGAIYLSGTTEDSQNGGYFIGRLNNNFVDGLPDAFEWTHTVKCTDNTYPKNNQPWDVDSDGHVYFVRGDSHSFNWSSMHKLNPQGERMVVEHWRTHWVKSGGEYRNTPASSYPGGKDSLSESAIVFKKDTRCNLRSWTREAYDAVYDDGNGGYKKGTWPLDAFFDGPCNPQDANPSTGGRGYTGYGLPSGTITYGPSSIVVDRISNNLFIGFNTRSVLPGGNPDFEPAVMAVTSDGALLWWSRLYHEVRPDSTMHNSSPDQYIDGLSIYYDDSDALQLIVNARCHGNNVENFWEGNTIENNPQANGFQNQFTGSRGNIHISWIGKLDLQNGILLNSTYVAEMNNSPSGVGAAHPNPLADGWPNPNSGWLELNTTRLQRNAISTTADGSVVIIGTGRRTMTTSNAHQKMPRPGTGGTSTWNAFLRQYNADLSFPTYSSIVVGSWDTLNQQLSSNVELFGVFKMRNGLLAVGHHTGVNGQLPTVNIPDWGSDAYEGPSAVIGYFYADELINPDDTPVTDSVVTSIVSETSNKEFKVRFFPNPVSTLGTVQMRESLDYIQCFDIMGIEVLRTNQPTLSVAWLPEGIYFLKVWAKNGNSATIKFIKSK